MDFSSIKDLSLEIIIGYSNDLNLNEIYKTYNERIKVLQYFNKIKGSKSVKEDFDKFDPKPLNDVISKYWGKIIKGVKCQKYTNFEGNDIFVFGILEKIPNFSDEKTEDLFIVYSNNFNLIFLRYNEIKQLING